MLGIQARSEGGSTAGLPMYGSRCYSYVLPVPPPAKRSESELYSQAYSRARSLSSWTPSANGLANGPPAMECTASAVPRPMATSTVDPADLSRLVNIEFAAFREEKTNHHLSYRDGSNRAHVRRTIRAYRDYMTDLRPASGDAVSAGRRRTDSRIESSPERETSLGFRFRKVTLPESGEIIAFCKSEMTRATPKAVRSPLDAGHEGEPHMNRDWFALNERLHREYCGLRKHCYFGMLATHPDHQHQGAASLLMDELVAEADQAGVEIYCEATKTGRALYEKYGFVAVKDIEFDTARYGGVFGVERQTVMVRGAIGKDGKRSKVRSWDEAVAESLTDMADSSLLEDVS